VCSSHHWFAVRARNLIWGISDYRETAVKLQKEWNIEDPQQLPFAQHVNVNALVHVMNRGLLYDESEREENLKVSFDIFRPELIVSGPNFGTDKCSHKMWSRRYQDFSDL
jgi:hypothetical protein